MKEEDKQYLSNYIDYLIDIHLNNAKNFKNRGEEETDIFVFYNMKSILSCIKKVIALRDLKGYRIKIDNEGNLLLKNQNECFVLYENFSNILSKGFINQFEHRNEN